MTPELVFTILAESPGDVDAIDTVTRSAFQGHACSEQNEHRIVHALREAGALQLSLVAALDGVVIGHAAFSPVSLNGTVGTWCGLGPLSVVPAHQRCGIGSALVRSGLRRLADRGIDGCVVRGDSAYYQRFGFRRHAGLDIAGFPSDRFMALAFAGAVPTGDVRYHPAFGRQATARRDAPASPGDVRGT